MNFSNKLQNVVKYTKVSKEVKLVGQVAPHLKPADFTEEVAIIEDSYGMLNTIGIPLYMPCAMATKTLTNHLAVYINSVMYDLSPAAQQAILAHEMGHLVNNDFNMLNKDMTTADVTDLRADAAQYTIDRQNGESYVLEMELAADKYSRDMGQNMDLAIKEVMEYVPQDDAAYKELERRLQH